jgi:hypothetical protein
MLRLVMEGSGLSLWPAISLVVFVLTSLAVLYWIYRPGSADFYRRLGGLALDDKGGASPAIAGTPRKPSSNPQIPSEN